MARTIPYRDLNGYIIKPKYKPIFDESRDKLSGGYRVAVLTYCPEIGGLKHIGECEKCEYFRGHAQYEGVKCASASTIEAPEYYNKVNPRKKLLNMETNKTNLQLIKEQLEAKMTRAIVEAIENGAECRKVTGGGVYIDGVYLTPKFGSEYHSLILEIAAPEIEQLFEPTKEDLKRRAEELRAQLTEIENELKTE